MNVVMSRIRVGKKKIRPIHQSGMLECAHACLAMVANYHGHKWTIESMRGKHPPSSRGTSVSQLLSMAQATGLDARVYRAEPSHLAQLRLPCILHWDLTHYVVLEALQPDGFLIVDPALGRTTVAPAEMSKRFSGIVVELEPRPDFQVQRPSRDNSALSMVWNSVRRRRRSVLSIVTLALLLEILALVSPLFIQVATDSILPSSDLGLLAVLTIAFLGAACVQSAIAISRSSLLMRLGQELTTQWSWTVADRLLKLPYVFFMQRSISDINSRFGSIHEIQRAVTHRFAESALDGATAAIGLVVIVYYSPWLAAMTVTMTALYALVRIGSNGRLARAAEASIRAQSAQQGNLLELLHGIHSIKAGGCEPTMLARHSLKTSDAAYATRHLQWVNALVTEGGQAVQRIHWIAAVAAGAYLAVNGTLSAGMLVAYLTYATQFTTRSTRFLDLISEWRMLHVHGARLADILSLDGEPEPTGSNTPAADGDISVEGLRFRYDQDMPWVLGGISFTVRSGECLAITGPSGSGKSTLAKVLIGLLNVGEGVVSIGGKHIAELDRAALRRRVACVLQDDQLFSGTVAENVAFFEPGFSREKVIHACKLAQIHEEILQLPLRYDTRIIDLGASLSGGQKQRLMLARALYREPEILVLDEASSHLDLENERRINAAIAALRVTRIIIAHRTETLAIADRVLELRDGRIKTASGLSQSATVEISGAPQKEFVRV